MKRKLFLILTIAMILFITSCKQEKFKVTFIGHNNEVLETIEVSSIDTINYPTPQDVEGYTFVKWDRTLTTVSENTTITAIYEINKYTVIFNDFNGNIAKEVQVEYNKDAIAPTLPLVEGYDFSGWDKSYTNIKSNVEVNPIYQKSKYTICFFDYDGNLIEEHVVEYGDSLTNINAPVREGFEFIQWDEDLTNIKDDLNVFPIYKELPKEDKYYEVKFIDIYNNIIDIQNVKEGESASSPITPTIPFHTFKEWDVDFSNVTKNMTVKAIYRKDTNTFFNTTADYWLCILSSNYDINAELLSQNELNDYNKKILSNYTATEVKDVLSITNTSTSSFVKGMLDQYTNINKYTIYDHNTRKAISATEKQNILNNRNYNGISSNVTVKYGIITDFAWLRSYPTNHYSNDYSMDRFQETSLNVGEGVAIYHTSLDNEWYFVQAENYNGWLEKKYVAECDYETLESFLKPNERILVISDYVKIEGSHVRMGQAFPMVAETTDSYTIKFPKRNTDGTLTLKEITVTSLNDYNKGYLTYNYYNVFTQAFKLLGIDYSWGDKDPLGRDCSSTMNAIYKCFGFMMPRNTSNQVATPSYGSKVSGLTNQSVQNYKPGSLIFTSSHVMLYLGVDAKGTAYLLHNTTSGDGSCILQSLDSYGGSKINGVLKLQ